MHGFARNSRLISGSSQAFAVLALIAALAGAVVADEVRLFSGNGDAARTRIELIQQATEEIDAAYYAVGDDEFTRSMLFLLRDAARRGVRVRLIVDAYENHMSDGLQAHLISEGVEIREFHPFRASRPCSLNRRMHEKIFVVDRCQAVLGSRNLEGEHFGLAAPGKNFVDREVYVRGSVANQAHLYFHRLWSSDEVRPTKIHDGTGLSNLCPIRRLSGSEECPCCAALSLDKAESELTCPCLGNDGACQDCGLYPTRCACARFLHDPCGRKKQPGAISDEILALIGNARESIILESPYLLVSDKLSKALAQAQSHGAEIVILTNSLNSTDQLLVYAGYSNQKKKLLERGIELWEFRGPDHLHAKSALIDGCISIIGSYNFDPRSEHLNTEVAVVVCDPCFADDLFDSLSTLFSQAWQVGADGKCVGSSIKHPGAERSKLFTLRCARLAALALKRQL
jgi:phosphatidylserine/phosphatidylglycerophosphate/cardiolipin synthase-like enzyme